MKIVIEKIADATAFTQLCSEQPFNVDLVSGRHRVDAKSQLGIFTLDLTTPCDVVIEAKQDGSQDKAVEAFENAISKFRVDAD